MKILYTADGERIVMDDDTADFLLGSEGEAMLRRKAGRAQLAAECGAELRACEREDDEETMAEIRLHARIEERRERE
jgi:hypothetical protein